MKLNSSGLLFVLSLSIGVPLWADTPPPTGITTPSNQFDDHFIQVQKTQVDKLIQKRDEMVSKRKPQPESVMLKYQNERMAFDRSLLVEKREFLDTLQAMPQPSRHEAWKNFTLKQAAARKSYSDSHKGELDALRQQLQKQNLAPIQKAP